jgi:hypothetical protein
MVNDRSGGSDRFAIPGQHSAKSSAFDVNERSNASSAFMVNDERSMGSQAFNAERSIGSIDFNINTMKSNTQNNGGL